VVAGLRPSHVADRKVSWNLGRPAVRRLGGVRRPAPNLVSLIPGGRDRDARDDCRDRRVEFRAGLCAGGGLWFWAARLVLLAALGVRAGRNVGGPVAVRGGAADR